MTPIIRKLIEWLRNRTRRVFTDAARTRGIVRVRVYDVDDLRHSIPDWDELTRDERAQAIRDAQVTPSTDQETTNVVLNEWHEAAVDFLDPSQTDPDMNVSHMAVGTSTTTPVATNTGLGTEVYRAALTTTTDQGRDLYTSLFLDSTEANGNTLAEMGLVTAASGGTFVNHALIDSIEKDSTKVATIDCTLQFRPA